MSLIRKSFGLLLLSIALGTIPLKAQFYLNGEDPARVKWNKIKGKNYTVIYPREIDSLAKRYLFLLEKSRNSVLAGLNINPKPLPVVLHPYTVKSNGMVVWTPKRMELYTQPPADAYAQNWETQLVLHETRHVGQISHFTKGIYKVGYALLGEQVTGIGVGVYPSRWFLEGDAVVSETELSNSGRGRDASFMEYYRAAFLQGHYRDWDRWRYGSYKHYTPDIYPLGYLITSTIRYRTGVYDYPGKVLDYMVKRFYNPGVDDAIYKKITGYRTIENFPAGVKIMDSIWRSELPLRGEFTNLQSLQHKKETYSTSYQNTVALSADSTLYIKSSYSQPTSLVLLSSNPEFGKKNKLGEKRLKAFSSNVEGFQLSPKRKIYFTEIINSARWQQESFNRLFYYDLATNKIKKLSGRTSYNSPTLNKQGDSVAVIEYPVKGGSNITLLDAESGKKYLSIPAPYHAQLTECAWIRGELFSFGITGKGMGLFKIDIAGAKELAGDQTERQDWDNLWKRVIDEQDMSFQSVNNCGDTIYFSSGIDGVTNIYMYNTQNGDFKRLTNSQYGVYDPSISGTQMFLSEMGLNGFSPVKTALQREISSGYAVELKNGKLTSEYKFAVAEELSRQANAALAERGIKRLQSEDILPAGEQGVQQQAEFNDSLQVKRYNKLWHLFRIHSWGPAYYNVDRIMAGSFDKLYDVLSWGATVYSQNTLGTAVTMLGYSYYKGFHAGHLNFTYSGLYPVFELSADINADDRYSLKKIVKNNRFEIQRNFLNSPLIETSLRAYIPFTFNSHGWQRGLTPQLQWEFNNNEIYNYKKEKFQYRNQANAAIQYYQMRLIATGAIFPKWGASVVVRGGMAPGDGENFGEVASAYTYGYLPGFASKQGIKLSVSYQKQFIDGKNFYLDNLVSMPRGYVDDLYGKSYFKATFDYAIPVYLGDVHISWLAYLKRLQIIPFADFAIMDKTNLYTYGADVLLDAIFFHIGTPVSIGVRYGRNGNNGNLPVDKNAVQMLFKIALQ